MILDERRPSSTVPAEHKALFLDRDGVINRDFGHVYRVEDFHLLPSVLSSCRRFHDAGYKLVVVTNQAGIAKGYYTVEDFRFLSRWMSGLFLDAGAPLSGIYYCPHHPNAPIEELKMSCNCRKPAPGLFLEAKQELNLDMKKSILVGDKPSDILAARAAGIEQCYLISHEPLETTSPELNPPPVSIRSLRELCEIIL